MLKSEEILSFLQLIDTSFSNFKDGKYEILDMGYIVYGGSPFLYRGE